MAGGMYWEMTVGVLFSKTVGKGLFEFCEFSTGPPPIVVMTVVLVGATPGICQLPCPRVT